MKLFEQAFYKSLAENNAAGAGGVFGDAGSMGHGGALSPMTDFYAPGDARNVFGLGVKSKKSKKKNKKDKKDKNHIQPLMPMQRRNLNRQM